MPRLVVSKVGTICVLWPLIVFALPASTSLAQSAATPPEEPPISKECQTPGVKLVLDKPLPHTLAALKDRKVIKIPAEQLRALHEPLLND